jgi:hypothetical protein
MSGNNGLLPFQGKPTPPLVLLEVALFFIDFSRKIPSKHGAMMIRYAGVVAMGFAIFIVTSYHAVVPAVFCETRRL